MKSEVLVGWFLLENPEENVFAVSSIFFFKFIFERERKCVNEHTTGGGAERERESQAGSALSAWTQMWGSNSQTLRSSPEVKSRVRRWTNWVTQVPLSLPLLKATHILWLLVMSLVSLLQFSHHLLYCSQIALCLPLIRIVGSTHYSINSRTKSSKICNNGQLKSPRSHHLNQVWLRLKLWQIPGQIPPNLWTFVNRWQITWFPNTMLGRHRITVIDNCILRQRKQKK